MQRRDCLSLIAFFILSGCATSGPSPERPLQINDGSEVTSEPVVTLRLAPPKEASTMYITQEPNCTTGGNWEKVKTKKVWPMDFKGEEGEVFVKFKSDRQQTQCYGEKILLDRTPPGAYFSQ